MRPVLGASIVVLLAAGQAAAQGSPSTSPSSSAAGGSSGVVSSPPDSASSPAANTPPPSSSPATPAPAEPTSDIVIPATVPAAPATPAAATPPAEVSATAAAPPVTATPAGAAPTATGANPAVANHYVDTLPPYAPENKFWQVVVGWESHFMIWQNNLNGVGDDRIFNYGYLYPHVDFLQYNRVSVYAGFFERFLADSGESGLRMDDTFIDYSRFIPLPGQLTVQARVRVTLPTSFESQKMSLIAAPGARLLAERDFSGHWGDLDLEVGALADWYFTQYTANAGGNPNPRARVGLVADVEYALPFHNRYSGTFSLGLDFLAADYWYYSPNGTGGPNMMEPPASANPQFPTQPIQTEYCGEVYARYQLPTLARHLQLEAHTSLASGDTELGCNSVNHDGVVRLYFDYFQTAEVYFTAVARY